ncbi:MAG: hypothetical protein ACOYLB_10920 [Phototrophicaceae bacterium]
MTFSQLYDERLQNYVETLTTATLHGEADVEVLAATYNIPLNEAQELAEIVCELDEMFSEVEPSLAFRQHLHAQLVGKPHAGLISRWHRLPARIRIAATVALLIAMVILGRRRLVRQLRSSLATLRQVSRDASEVTAIIP